MKLIKSSIAAIRKAWPFACVNQKGMLDSIPQLKDVNEAVKRYQRSKDFFNSYYYMKLHYRADYKGAPMELRLFVWRYMRALRKRGLPFYVHTCYRPPSEQEALKKQGFSTLSSGAHQRSCAVDIVSAVDHWEIPDDLWIYVGTLGESIARDTAFGEGLDRKPLKIEWGGRFKSLYDPAHFQLSDWKRRPVIHEAQPPLRLQPYSDRMRFG